MLSRVRLKVSQLTLEYCSIPRSAIAVESIICRNITDFEVNCCDWKRLNDQTICALCRKDAIFISCGARLILEQDLANKIVMCEHFGIHRCLRHMAERKEGVEKLVQGIPQVTRECFIWQQVHNAVETGGFSKAVETVTQFVFTTYIDNVGQNLLTFDYNNGVQLVFLILFWNWVNIKLKFSVIQI